MPSNGEGATSTAHKSADSDDEAQDQRIEGDPKPLPYAFEKELIDKSNSCIRLRNGFVPIGAKVHTLACKFYARHEQRQPAQPERFLRYVKVPQSERRTQLGLPRLESQVYGWLPTFGAEADARQAHTKAVQLLNFVHAPKRRCYMTVHGELLIAERITERPVFNGLRFLLH